MAKLVAILSTVSLIINFIVLLFGGSSGLSRSHSQNFATPTTSDYESYAMEVEMELSSELGLHNEKDEDEEELAIPGGYAKQRFLEDVVFRVLQKVVEILLFVVELVINLSLYYGISQRSAIHLRPYLIFSLIWNLVLLVVWIFCVIEIFQRKEDFIFQVLLNTSNFVAVQRSSGYDEDSDFDVGVRLSVALLVILSLSIIVNFWFLHIIFLTYLHLNQQQKQQQQERTLEEARQIGDEYFRNATLRTVRHNDGNGDDELSPPTTIVANANKNNNTNNYEKQQQQLDEIEEGTKQAEEEEKRMMEETAIQNHSIPYYFGEHKQQKLFPFPALLQQPQPQSYTSLHPQQQQQQQHDDDDVQSRRQSRRYNIAPAGGYGNNAYYKPYSPPHHFKYQHNFIV